MSDQQDNINAPEQPSLQIEKEIPLDTRLLSEAVIELNISRKNVGIYPPGHIQITKSIDRAYEILQKLFEIRSEMTFGVAKDTLLVGQDYLDRKNPVYRDFALSLNQQSIASVTFIRGLEKNELIEFHRIITTKPEDIVAAGGISKVMGGSGISHVRIRAIDYGSFYITEEQEIFKSQGKGGPGTGTGISTGSGFGTGETVAKPKAGHDLWQEFVTHLTAGKLATSGEGVSLKETEQIDPAELARLLNELRLDSNVALQSYDQIISEHLRVAAEKKQLSQEQSKTLSNLNMLLKDLHPELRKQFLSVAFRRISTHTKAMGAEDLLGGFPDDIVIDMLNQASAEGKEISPTLTGLLGKLTRAQAQSVQSSQLGERGKEGAREKDLASSILPEHMEKLFDREKYEEYVSDDYQATLKRLSEASGVLAERIPVDEYAKTLEEDHLDFQIGRALIAFMEEDIDEEDYREFGRKLVTLVPEFLKTGNFVLLLDILETIRKQMREKPTENLRAMAADCLKIFSDPSFMDQSRQAFDGWASTKGREASNFLYALGPAMIPGLMDLYAIDTTPGGRRVLFDLLCRFGQDAVREAIRRLSDPRIHYVRNLVMLIRWAGTPAAISSIKFLLNKQDVKVRIEVLTTLLKFKDPDAPQLLRETIRSQDPDVASQAVFLAGQFRVTEAVNDLLSLIKRVILFEADYTVNEEIIKALGEIGDPRAIGDLERLARARTLYPRRRLKMQQLLFASLGRYPVESITGLLQIGERSGDATIRKSCKKLMQRDKAEQEQY
jgi:HEAT repeat protein